MRLATFVHISDLHFGLNDPGSFDARAPDYWAKFSHLDGLLGHSYRSLVRLEQFFDRKRREEGARLIVTGDLTTVGRGAELETAQEYLGAELVPPKGNYVGLRVPDWKERAVPGNHDHWPGHAAIFGPPPAPAPPAASLAAFFPGLPFMTDPPLPLGSRHTLRFLWVDTDADVWPYGKNRFFARGSFVSQLTTLGGMLGVPDENEIRVLCLHHSRANTGFLLGTDRVSRDSLDDFIAEHDVAVLLTGHMHDPPLMDPFNVIHLMSAVDCLEARCGTTTQLSTLPYTWRTVLGYRPARPSRWPNSLLVHRLVEKDDEIYWHAEVNLEKPQGFQKPASLHGGAPVEIRVRVWPRP